ncbi:LacI family DNA-binding transcriptional regulator [Mucilaginibacter lappiensis]|uniref:DNA-binding LacI/PurR family transcriptional regulator n=1 Tax=Mucilaginibacter lappiensis TaxID=354630 RepID=A0A841JDW7_9SPHI|nr:LacI family DNA-binding transcriptional regulator [Mucilaginibacter lappiensis]MBB6126665.1 DNA-binding LacI/PurR family transcriptional regulator [Mucilaginibacter lappiensis]
MERKKITTIKMIASVLNVAPSTVSRALNGHPGISPVTTDRVRKVALAQDYIPNQAAISFHKKRSYTLGLIVPEFSEPFFSSALNAIENIASAHNYNIMIGQSHDDMETEISIVRKFMDHRIDGLIISIAKKGSDYQQLSLLEKLNIPVVFFDCVSDRRDVHFVASNLQTGLLKGINELVMAGHHKIALINGPATLSASRQRLIAYAKGLKERGIELESDLIVATDLSHEGNLSALNKLIGLNEPPTAVIVFNDYVFLDCFGMLASKGLKDLFKFISFGNLPDWGFFQHRPFGSIEQFPAEQGQMAASILIELMNEISAEEQAPIKCIQKHIDSDIIFFSDRTKAD